MLAYIKQIRLFLVKDILLFFVILSIILAVYSMRFMIWSIALLVILFIWQYKKNSKIDIKSNLPVIFPFFFYFVLVLGLLYTKNINRGLDILQRFLPFLIYPLVFLSISKKLLLKHQYFIMKLYILSIYFFYLFLLVYAVLRQINLYFEKHVDHINWYYFYRFDFLSLFHQHPTYISMFSLMALSFLLFSKASLNFKATQYIIVLITIIMGIFFAGSRQGYLQLILIIMLYIFFSYKTKKLSPKKVFIYFLSFAILFFLILKIPIIKERIFISFGKKQYYHYYLKKEVASDKDNPEKQGRLLSWHDALELIKESPVLGYGTGSDNDVLVERYLKNNHRFLYKMKFNAHNSYLQWLLSGGIWLFLAYLLLPVTLLYYGIKQTNYLLISLFVIVFFTSFTETFYRIQGIVFIAFFYSFLMRLYHQSQSKSLVHKTSKH